MLYQIFGNKIDLFDLCYFKVKIKFCKKILRAFSLFIYQNSQVFGLFVTAPLTGFIYTHLQKIFILKYLLLVLRFKIIILR